MSFCVTDYEWMIEIKIKKMVMQVENEYCIMAWVKLCVGENEGHGEGNGVLLPY